ncbi:MAG: DUF4340 domain-containing protein [Planctomycetota bacterium]|nr:MAG: DUF4340 domain-containing protein [Planctomycetota bacterium]
MTNRKLTILSIVAVVTVVWAVVQSRISNRPRTEADKPRYLIQGLDPADVGSIVLSSTENTVTLKRTGGHFVVLDKDNYPADASQINELITSCLDIKTDELYTDDPENHKALGVTEDDARSAVKFFKPDSSLLTGVVIGKPKQQGRGTYVRLASSNKVYGTEQAPWIRDQAMDYIEPELISLEHDDIESVTVTSDNESYTLKAEEGGVVLENPPEDKTPKRGDIGRVFNALKDIRFDDVQKKTAADDLSFDGQFVCRLKDSTVYTIDIAQKNDKTYVACHVEFTDTTPVTKDKGVESEEQLKEKEAKLLARDKANEFSAKHSGWVYEIADYKAENLTKQLSELLEEKQEHEHTNKVDDPDS